MKALKAGTRTAFMQKSRAKLEAGLLDVETVEQTGGGADRGELRSALLACAAGDARGVDIILRLEGARLLGVGRRMLGHQALAEDALQDAMVQIWRKAGQFRAEDGSARGWIYAVLRNRCRSILRDGRRLSTLSPEDLSRLQESRQNAIADDGWEMLPGSSRLKDCLAQLDGKSRHAILLAHVAGYSHGEIAAVQGVPLGTAKSWIRRGLSALRGCLS
jgi:RNA polymerase sigma-70 factor, ECF subfamily